MTLDPSIPASVLCRSGVHQVPGHVRSLCTFEELDYIDSFTLRTPRALERSAEGWARSVLEEAALSRRSARRLWRLMGLRLGPTPYAPDYVQGWAIAGAGTDWIRLETRSWYLSAQAVCLVADGEVSLSLSLRFDNAPVAHLIWAFVQGPHQHAVPIMLRQAHALVVGSSNLTDHLPNNQA